MLSSVPVRALRVRDRTAAGFPARRRRNRAAGPDRAPRGRCRKSTRAPRIRRRRPPYRCVNSLAAGAARSGSRGRSACPASSARTDSRMRNGVEHALEHRIDRRDEQLRPVLPCLQAMERGQPLRADRERRARAVIGQAIPGREIRSLRSRARKSAAASVTARIAASSGAMNTARRLATRGQGRPCTSGCAPRATRSKGQRLLGRRIRFRSGIFSSDGVHYTCANARRRNFEAQTGDGMSSAPIAARVQTCRTAKLSGI